MCRSVTLEEVLSRCKGVRRDGRGWMVRCPVHDDENPSLRIWEEEDGRLACHCFAGCEQAAVRQALGLSPADDDDWTPRGSAIATYPYTDEVGTTLFIVCRTANKQFPCYVPDPSAPHGKRWTLSGVRRVLYDLPDVRAAARAGQLVFVVEGEKDVSNLRQLGLVATTSPGGASASGRRPKWREEYSESLRGARVAILPDNDEPGRAHAEAIATSLRRKGIPCSIVPIPGLPAGGDVSDAIAAGLGRGELLALADAALAGGPTAGRSTDDGLFLTAAELAAIEPEEIDYLCPPYLPLGCVVELTGKVKGGKTTFALDACRAVLTGDLFLGTAAVRAPVIYATEERRQTFRAALRRVGIGGSPDLHILFRYEAGGLAWPKVVELIEQRVRQTGARLVVIDTLADWAGLAGDQENDAGHALAAVRPLCMLAAAGPVVLMVRHERKSGGEIVDAGRGSSQFPGAADVVISLAYPTGEGHDNRRNLHAIGRLDDIPRRVVVEYEGGRYELLGAESAIARRDARAFLLDHLPKSEEQAVTMATLVDEAGTRFGRSTIQQALREHEREGTVCKARGVGNASKRAYGYWLAEVPS